MNNKEKLKKEINTINASEELITKTKNKIEEIKNETNKGFTFNKKVFIPAACCAVVVFTFLGVVFSSNNITILNTTGNNKYASMKVLSKKESEEEFKKFLDESGMSKINENSNFKIIISSYASKTDYSTYDATIKYIKYMNKYRNIEKVVEKTKYNENKVYDTLGINKNKYKFLLVDYKYMICIPETLTNYITIIDTEEEQLTYYKLYLNDDTDFNTYCLQRIDIGLTDEMKKNNPGFNAIEDIAKEKEENKEDVASEDKKQEENKSQEENKKETNKTPEEVVTPKTYGDVDRNGIIQSLDVTLIKQHVAGIKKINDADARKAADVNGDGLITGADAILLQYAVVKAIDFDGNSTTNAILYGDINMDGTITKDDYNDIKRHVDGEIKLTYTNIADINADGNVNGTDLYLIDGILNGTYKHNNLLKPVTNYIIYGDADNNGKIQSYDATVIKQYLAGSRTLDSQQLKNADVDANGVINETDAKLIQEFVVQMHENTLPFKPIK